MLKVGDKIKMLAGAYAFGVKNGKYDNLDYCSQKGPFTVVKAGLKITIDIKVCMSNKQPAIADILITDNNGGFWFVPSQFAHRIPTHTIRFDDGTAIEISDASYEALKRQLV